MDLPGSVMMSLKVRLDSTTLLDVNAGLRVADQTRLGTETTTSWYRRCYLLVGPSGKSASPWMVSRAGVVVLLSNLLDAPLVTGRVNSAAHGHPARPHAVTRLHRLHRDDL